VREEHEGSREHGLWLLIRLGRILSVGHKQQPGLAKPGCKDD